MVTTIMTSWSTETLQIEINRGRKSDSGDAMAEMLRELLLDLGFTVHQSLGTTMLTIPASASTLRRAQEKLHARLSPTDASGNYCDDR